nr:MAG TPA: hypothetical protein [Caudoviricetes sp.]
MVYIIYTIPNYSFQTKNKEKRVCDSHSHCYLYSTIKLL